LHITRHFWNMYMEKWHAIHFIPPQKHWQLPRWTYSKIRTL